MIVADLANDLLAQAAECLATTARGTPTDAMVAHGPNQPRNPDCDHLTVHVGQITPTRSFPAAMNLPLPCASVGRSVRFVVRLRRACYPRIRGTSPMWPTDEEVSAASIDLLDDAETLWCCILAAYTAEELFMHPNLPGLQLQVIWGTMVPYRQADVAGWDWPMDVGVDAYCYTPGGSGS